MTAYEACANAAAVRNSGAVLVGRMRRLTPRSAALDRSIVAVKAAVSLAVKAIEDAA